MVPALLEEPFARNITHTDRALYDVRAKLTRAFFSLLN
jgi:hypothetical protein